MSDITVVVAPAQSVSAVIGLQGPPGASFIGADGADGLSAYQVATSHGFTGTESEWLLSLVGATGPSGAGLNILGSYATSLDLQAAHPTGTVGDAYLIAGNLYVWDGAWGNVGNIQGLQGVQGVAGADGPAGVGVPIGGTTGQVLAKVDANDYNSTWIDHAAGGGLTNPMTTAGDIIIGGVSGSPERLAKGTDGQVLTVVAGVPAYAAASGGSATIDWTSPLVVTDTANLTYGKHYIVAVTAADKTLTLPEITAADYGKMIVIEIAAATTKLITIDGYSTQVIDNALNRVMWASEVAQVVATTAGWTKVGGKSIPMVGGTYVPSDQTWAANTDTLLNMTAVFQGMNTVSGMVDTANKRIIAVRASKYLSMHSINYRNSNTTTTRVGIQCYVNSSTRVSQSFGAYIASNFMQPTATFNLNLSTNDYVQAYGFFASGTFATSVIYSASADSYHILQEIPQW